MASFNFHRGATKIHQTTETNSKLADPPCPKDDHLHSLTDPSWGSVCPTSGINLTANGIGYQHRLHSQSYVERCYSVTLVAHATAAKESQKTYLALKQPPYRPPPQVFGPMWTALYGLMGYSAYRAWDTGISSLNPNVVALTKVQLPLPFKPSCKLILGLF